MKLKIQNGAIEIKGKVILNQVNFEVNDKEHIAIVGRNGVGKTTLLKGIINNELFTEGIGEEKFEIIKIGSFKIGYLKQIKINENMTMIEELTDSFEEIIKLEEKIRVLENNLTSEKNILDYSIACDRYQVLGGYTYKKNIEIMIKKFGFSDLEKNKRINLFSGGEKMKIAFMKLLLLNPDLLILDEPTNHLDITTIEWLEEYLKNYKKAFIVVSHDRMFLDNTVDIIYDISYGEVIRYVGNYSKFMMLKKERYDKLLKDYEREQEEIKRLYSLYEKFRSKPTKAAMALSKLKQIERMEKLEKPYRENTKVFKANLKNIQKPSNVVLSCKDVSFGYNEILGELNLDIERGKKIGIIGPNGSGKSTLLKTLSKMLAPLKGKINYGYNVNYKYFDQNLEFKTNDTVIKEFMYHFPDMLNEEARKALGSFMFTGEDVDKKLSVLSGGEKVRLLLCEIFYAKPNLLFLDEPTNHLDMVHKEALEELLKNYSETIIFVSHDRYFVSSLASELLVFTDDGIKHYKCGYQEYIQNRKYEIEEKSNKNIIK
ncbi:ABC-F family ATP-binding cassette domain-containing protein, partial [Campylobacter coli]|nr:ABC-F family ATP-binding cassette domain-containing protein [Campylobacter coli]